MSKNTRKSKYVFRQICEFLNRDAFEWYVAEYNGNHYIKTLSSWQHLLIMILGQLWQCRSLRVLVNVLNSQSSKLYQLGIGLHVSRSTLSDANNRRDYRIFEEMANLMIRKAREKRLGYCKDQFLDDKRVFAFDSSTISLCLSIFWWSRLHHDKGGIKLHTLYEIKTDIPAFVYISDASLHDSKAMLTIAYESGAYYVFDRAYMALFNLYAIHQVGAFFVVREKRNMRFKIVEDKYYNNPDSGILADQLIEFTGYLTHKRYPEVLRRIVFYDIENSRRFVFYTNNLSVSAEGIALLYKYRWRVELFFKWIKQHLHVKEFYGTSENAVRIQIYCAIITYCLVAIIEHDMQLNMDIYSVIQILSASAIDRIPLRELFENSKMSETEGVDEGGQYLIEF